MKETLSKFTGFGMAFVMGPLGYLLGAFLRKDHLTTASYIKLGILFLLGVAITITAIISKKKMENA